MKNKLLLFALILCACTPIYLHGAAAPFVDYYVGDDGGSQQAQMQKGRLDKHHNVTTLLHDAGNAGDVAGAQVAAQMLTSARLARKVQQLRRGTVGQRKHDLIREELDDQALQPLRDQIAIKDTNDTNYRAMDMMDKTDLSRRELQERKIQQNERDAERTRFSRYFSYSERIIQNAFSAAGQSPAVGLSLVVGQALLNRDFKLLKYVTVGTITLKMASKAEKPATALASALYEKMSDYYEKIQDRRLTPEQREKKKKEEEDEEHKQYLLQHISNYGNMVKSIREQAKIKQELSQSDATATEARTKRRAELQEMKTRYKDDEETLEEIENQIRLLDEQSLKSPLTIPALKIPEKKKAPVTEKKVAQPKLESVSKPKIEVKNEEAVETSLRTSMVAKIVEPLIAPVLTSAAL